jgi:sulfite reductase (ferredoxin)
METVEANSQIALKFVRLFNEEYLPIKDDTSLNLELPEIKNEAKPSNLPVEKAEGDDYELWKRRFVFDQKQAGLKSVKVPLRLGDLLAEDADKLCNFLDHIGENTIRCDRAQNIRLRNIPEHYLGNLYNVIKSMKMTLVELPPFLSNMINCTGAQTCKLGICLPRGLSDAICDRLGRSDLRLDEISDFRVNMSGCPNTCGMHHIADLGFFGKIGRKEAEIYPAYNVLAGAHVGQAGMMQYAERVDEIPSKQVPHFLYDFLSVWIDKKKEFKNDYHKFLEEEGKALIKTLCAKYKEVPMYEENPEMFHDWGRNRRMTLDDMGTAECSAGLFDMIDVDKKQIEEISKTAETGEDFAKLVFHASRMLLVTRGLEAKNEEQAIELFAKHFVTAGLVDEKFQDILLLAKRNLTTELAKEKTMVLELGTTVIDLYKNMDDSLRFKVEPKEDAGKENSTKDFRGVQCPMNFVKTKLVLDTLQKGDRVEVLLDSGEPIENVPNSVEMEGHKVIHKIQKPEGHWSVLIEKA